MSVISTESALEFLREDKEELNDDEIYELNRMILASETFVKKYTGIADISEHEDLKLATLFVIQSMYDNRSFVVEDDKLHPTAKTILDMNSENLL